MGEGFRRGRHSRVNGAYGKIKFQRCVGVIAIAGTIKAGFFSEAFNARDNPVVPVPVYMKSRYKPFVRLLVYLKPVFESLFRGTVSVQV